MAKIIVNEISQNYTYNIGNNAFCTVALPITACWGPGYFQPDSYGVDHETMLENTTWQHFEATQSGLESFVSTYKGPASCYRSAKDYSYQIAMSLLTAGYDVLVCRACPGVRSSAKLATNSEANYLTLTAKYPGTFGNTLLVTLNKVPNKTYWNLIVYSVDSVYGTRTSLENLIFAFDLEHVSDNIPHITEAESKYIDITVVGAMTDDTTFNDTVGSGVRLQDGDDSIKFDGETQAKDRVKKAKDLAFKRYLLVSSAPETTSYVAGIETVSKAAEGNTALSESQASTLAYREWLYTAVCGYKSDENSPVVSGIYSLLTDKLSYNPNRVISPGWDDQDLQEIDGNKLDAAHPAVISPMHHVLMNTAYLSRCATALLDIPRSLPRSLVYDSDTTNPGYAQKLARSTEDTLADNATIFETHSALFAPWGQYQYVGTSKQATASPSFLALLIQRAMILNQSLQYEWAMPSNRKHSVAIGKLEYNIPKKILDVWQTLEGVGVNAITTIPGLGTTIWGNSTLYEVPPATYQAGVTPLLDTMKNVGAIDDYYVRMSADINGLDQVNANTVIGKVYLVVNGIINDIIVDLVALPPGTDLTQFAQ